MPEPDSSRRSEERSYVVLEETPLAEFLVAALSEEGRLTDEIEHVIHRTFGELEVYRKVAIPVAHNTEGALRAAAKEAYDTDSTPMMVAIAQRSFQPQIVRVGTRRTVTVG